MASKMHIMFLKNTIDRIGSRMRTGHSVFGDPRRLKEYKAEYESMTASKKKRNS